jgi:DNA-binding transcriptional LysR family regulator
MVLAMLMLSMSLNLLFVKYFCYAVKMGSVSASSKVNFVTQSAVSQGITKLEQLLNCHLLARHPNRFRLTPAGQKAFEQLSEILNKAMVFQQNFSVEHLDQMGSLEFACSHSFALNMIPQYLQRFRVAYPDVKVNFHCLGSADAIFHHLKAGSIDFGILADAKRSDEFEYMSLYRGSYGLYSSCDLSYKREAVYHFILPEPEDTSFFQAVYHQKFSKPPDIILKVGSWEVVANLVEEGLGIGYFPDYVAAKKPNLYKCDFLDLQLPEYEISAVYLEGMRLRKSSEVFLSYFQDSMQAK